MGHASSKEVRHEPHNPRRLSKPPTYSSSSSYNISQSKQGKASNSAGQDATLDESMFWKSPWTGDLLPKVAPETSLTDRDRVRSLASLSTLHPESSAAIQGSKRWSSLDDFALTKQDSPLSRSSSYISRRLSRRASTNSQNLGSQLQSAQMSLRDSRREPIIHFGPTDIGNRDSHSFVEVLNVEDRSPVEDSHSRVLLGRRQSSRRPGVATRTPSWGLYRTALSSIQQEEERMPTWPLPAFARTFGSEDPEEDREEYMPIYPSSGRATSPVALDYSHLSGFKKGTLRVVNDYGSPVSNDRIRLLKAPSPLPNRLDETVHAHGDSTTFVSGTAYCDDTVEVPNNHSFDEDVRTSENTQSLEAFDFPVSAAIDFSRMEKTQSITNVDSGYSSLSSIRSANSSGLSRSPPMDSPVRRTIYSEEESVMEKGVYFDNEMAKQPDFRSGTLHDIGSEKFLIHQEREANPLVIQGRRYTSAEQPRYYACLGLLSIPSVPEEIAIYDKESDSEDFGEIDEDKCAQMSPLSPILPKSAFGVYAQKHTQDYSCADENPRKPHRAKSSKSMSRTRLQVSRADQLVKTPRKAQEELQLSNIVTGKSQNLDPPRGRALSRSVGHPRSKLVKARKGKENQ